jgi:hypothetical protein
MDDSNEITDLYVTNNGDTMAIFSSIYQAMLIFSDAHKGALISFKGNSMVRNRLFRMIISRYKVSIDEHYMVFGLSKSKWHSYIANQAYEAFLFKYKIS